jgi:hypothetical protein
MGFEKSSRAKMGYSSIGPGYGQLNQLGKPGGTIASSGQFKNHRQWASK